MYPNNMSKHLAVQLLVKPGQGNVACMRLSRPAEANFAVSLNFLKSKPPALDQCTYESTGTISQRLAGTRNPASRV